MIFKKIKGTPSNKNDENRSKRLQNFKKASVGACYSLKPNPYTLQPLEAAELQEGERRYGCSFSRCYGRPSSCYSLKPKTQGDARGTSTPKHESVCPPP